MNKSLAAEYVVSYAGLEQQITISLTEHDVEMAKEGYLDAQQRLCKIVAWKYKSQGVSAPFMVWNKLQLEETEASKQQPRGCDCSCGNCKDEDHCKIKQRHCYK